LASWVAGTNAPDITITHGYAAVNGIFYRFGGIHLEDVNTPLDKCYAYNITQNSWVQIANLPEAARNLFAAAVNTNIYVFENVSGKPLTIKIYNTLTDTWAIGPAYDSGILPINRISSYGNRIYLYSWSSRVIHVFDTETFSFLSNIPIETSKYYYATESVKTYLYLLGGRINDAVYNTVNKFNTVVRTWEEFGALPVQIEYSGSAVFEDTIYLVGGMVGGKAVSTVLIYNTVDDSTSFGMPLPRVLYDTNCAVTNGYLVSYGGAISGTESYVSNIHILDLKTATTANPSPAAGFIDETINNIFSWELITSPSSAIQASAVFQWRVANASAINTINISGSSQSITIPSGTFPNGNIQWRVRATGSNGIESDFTEWLSFATIDAIHHAPTNLYPHGSYKQNATRTIQFSWITHSPQSTPQRAFEIQVSYDNGSNWISFGKVISPSNTFILSGGTLTPGPSGIVTWRVRTYNSDDVASPWSSTASFLALTAPNAPQWISVTTGSSRPTAKWVSTAQIGWRLQVLRGTEIIYDTGMQYGTDTEHMIRDFLANGQYTFQIQIENELQLESAWATRQVNISARNRLNISLSGEAQEKNIMLSFEVEVRS